MKFKYTYDRFECNHIFSDSQGNYSLSQLDNFTFLEVYKRSKGVLRNKKDRRHERYVFCDECLNKLIGFDFLKQFETKSYQCPCCGYSGNLFFIVSLALKVRPEGYFYFCPDCWSKIGGNFLMEYLESCCE